MKRPTLLLLTGTGILLVMIVFLSGLFRPVGDLARRVLGPGVRGFAWIGQTIGRLFGAEAFSDQALLAQNHELQARLTTLTVDYASCRALQEEVRSLRAQAHFLGQSGFESVGAHVIGREVRHERAEILIDRGSQDQVEVGQAVITDDGVLIGKIMQIREQVASVQLLSDPNSRASVTFSSAKGLSGVLEGRGNGAMVMTYIPSSVTALQNQLVVTAGLEEKVPANLSIGTVSQVEGKSTDPFFSAVVEAPINLDQIHSVSVLRPRSAGSSL